MGESEVKPHLHENETKRPPTPEEVKESMEGRVGATISFEKFLQEGEGLSCVDGREPKEIVGTPGGTAGEFLLMLAAFEEATGETIQPDDVRAILERYIETVPRFYLHTDAHAFHHLEEQYGHINLQTGEGADQETLLEELSQPEHIGCGHIKFMFLQGEKYHIRPALVQESLKAIYQLKWAGEKKIGLVTLKGDHKEGAVVVVTVEGDITPQTKLPLLKPNTEEGGQVFVYHPQAAEAARAKMTEDIARIMRREVDTNTFEKALKETSAAQLGATLENLAKEKPIITARCNQEGKIIEVTGNE